MEQMEIAIKKKLSKTSSKSTTPRIPILNKHTSMQSNGMTMTSPESLAALSPTEKTQK
jgi:hypothetical protein